MCQDGGTYHKHSGKKEWRLCRKNDNWAKSTGVKWASLMAQQVRNLPTMARDTGSIPGLGKSPGGGKWQSTPVFLPKKSCAQRSLAGCSPEGRKESDTADRLSMHRGELELDKQGSSVQFSPVTQSCPTLCDPMDCACQTSLSITSSRSLLKLMSIVSVMSSNHLILSSRKS